MKITVLAGGLSPERDVSLSSGSLIANALMKRGHKVALVDLYYGIKDCSKEAINKLFDDRTEYSFAVPEHEPDLEAIKKEAGNGDALIGNGIIEICRAADRVFIALHGACGENGQLQATLDMFGIKYTGSGYLGAALAMDKDIAKKLARAEGILTADWITLSPGNGCAEEILSKVGLPCVIKPCGCGSSVGVTVVRDRDSLNAALKYAEKYENRIIAEKLIEGRELTCGVLNGQPLPPVEIRPKAGFYDYKNKYQSGLTEELCPAPLDDKTTRAVQSAALKVHEIIGLGSYSRSDFILEKSTGRLFWLEVNTLPGMTPTSLVPQEAAASGIDYGTLCEMIAKA